MANRYFNQFHSALEKKVVSIYAHVTFDGSGVPTLDVPNSKGVVSVTHDSTGVYTFVFGTSAQSLDPYVKLLMINQVAQAASGHPENAMFVLANNISDSTKASIQVEFDDLDTPAATDPISCGMYFEFIFGDSTAP